MMRLAALALALIFIALPARASEVGYYVLALSWSPAFCASKGYDAPPEQCDVNEPFRFIVHGLWPQGENDERLNFCDAQGRLSDRVIDDMMDIMPSEGLVIHQWRKHGSCSGLSQVDYFALTRQAFEKIRIPDAFERMAVPFRTRPEAIERAFSEANPGLQPNMMAVICESQLLREVRICLNDDLSFRQCPAIDQTGCRGRPLGVLAPR